VNGGYNAITQENDVGIIWGDTIGGTVGSQTGNLVIAPWSSNTYGLKVTRDGKIGINNSAPNEILDISGQNITLKMRDGRDVASSAAGIQFLRGTNPIFGGGIYTDWEIKAGINGNLSINQGINDTSGTIMSFEAGSVVGNPHKVTIYGNLYAGNVEAYIFNATSDYRIKENPILLNDTFYVDDLKPKFYKNKLSNREDMGFIAHEVQEVFPFLVNGTKDGSDYQSVNYNGFIALLVKEIQELKKRLKTTEDHLKTVMDKLAI
jgi:hypothetical protein